MARPTLTELLIREEVRAMRERAPGERGILARCELLELAADNRGGEMRAAEWLLGKIVADHGVAAAVAEWWLRMLESGRDLDAVEAFMGYEDLLYSEDDPRYTSEFITRVIARKNDR